MLDLSKAVTAQAPAVATAMGFSVPVTGSSVSVSSAFGNAGQGFGSLVAVDRYGRDYAVDLTGAFARESGGLRVIGFAAPAPSLLAWNAGTPRDLAALALRDTDRERNHALAQTRIPVRLSLRLTGSTLVDIGRGGGGGMLAGWAGHMLLTGDVGRGLGLSGGGDSISVLQAAGRNLVIEATAARTVGTDGRPAANTAGLALAHGPTRLRLGVTHIGEARSVLGLTGRGAFATGGASTVLGEIGWNGTVAGWVLGARGLIGHTSAVTMPGSLLQFDGAIMSSGFALDATHAAGPGLLRLGLASPLRADRARLGGSLPTGFDLASGTGTVTTFASDIAARSRELDVEVGYALAFAGGRIEFAGAHAFDAGNVAGRSSSAAVVRLALIR